MPSLPKRDIDQSIENGEVYVSPKRRYKGRICGAATRHNHDRNKGFCQLPAGHQTDHPGQGRCKFHGGSVPRKHGRYSKIKSKPLQTLVEAHETDPEPLDLLPDLAVARALLEDAMNHLAKGKSSTHAVQVEIIRKLLSTIASIVSKIETIRSENAIARADFLRIMSEMGRVVETYVHDPEVLESIHGGWLAIRLV